MEAQMAWDTPTLQAVKAAAEEACCFHCAVCDVVGEGPARGLQVRAYTSIWPRGDQERLAIAESAAAIVKKYLISKSEAVLRFDDQDPEYHPYRGTRGLVLFAPNVKTPRVAMFAVVPAMTTNEAKARLRFLKKALMKWANSI